MEKYAWIITFVFTCLLQGVLGEVSIDDVSGLVAAAVIGFFLLIIVVVFIALGLTWNSWYPKVQRWRGRVKIPNHIINLRKKMAMEREASAKSYLVANGSANKPNTSERDTKSWVEGWVLHGRERDESKEYETKDATITLGEENPQDDNYRIEAEIVYNEVLDLGPYTKMPDQTIVVSSRMETSEQPDSPLYAAVDKASQRQNHVTSESYNETETSFSAMAADPSVVIL